MAKRPRIRFSFQIANGPNQGLSCGGWRVWTHAEDTYITAKSLGDTWKVSLHADAWWANSVTQENARRDDTVLPVGLNRSLWRFEPTPFIEGRRLAFGIAVCRNALLPRTFDETDEVLEVPDRWDVLTVAAAWMTEPGSTALVLSSCS